MNCAQWEDRIALYAGGDLSAEESAEVRRHLDQCAECAQFAAGLAESLALMRAAHAEPLAPADFVRVRAAVVARTGRSVLSFRLAWIAAALAAVALALVLIAPHHTAIVPPPAAVVAHQWGGPPGPPSPSIKRRAPRPLRARQRLRRPVGPRHGEQVLVRIVTDNPDVVIYWIADPRGE